MDLIYRMNYKIKWLLGKMKPYNGLLDVFESLSFAEKKKKAKKRILFYTNSCGERFWIKYFSYYVAKTWDTIESVDYLWSDEPLYPQASPKKEKLKEFYKWSSDFLKKKYVNKLRLMTSSILEQNDGINEISEAEIKEVAVLDYCYLNQVEKPDIGHEETELFKYRETINKEFANKFERLLKSKVYDQLIILNGCLFENAIALKIAKKLGLSCITMEIGEKFDRILLAENDEAWCFDSKKYFDIYREKYLEKKLFEETVQFLKERKNPKLGKGNASQFQKAELEKSDQIKKRLSIPPGRKVALACTNVAWDSAVLGKGRAFSSQEDWICFLLEYYRSRPDWFLIIRIHPHEALIGTNAPVGEIIKKNTVHQPMENLAVVGDGLELNTYSLANIANLGLVYSSSIGMEMAIDGLPVVTAAKVHYSGLNFTLDPNTAEDFGAILDEAEKLQDKLPIDFYVNATAYYGIYHNEIFKKAPWNWGVYQKNGFVDLFMSSVEKDSKIFEIFESGNIYV